MRQRRLSRLIIIGIIILLAAWVVWPQNPGLRIGSFEQPLRLVRGLDLQGGLQVLLEADLPDETEVTSEQMATARTIIEKRVNGLGVTEPLVQLAGSRRILVELPGIGDTQQAVETIQETGLLEFIDLTREDAAGILPEAKLVTDFGTAPVAAAGDPEQKVFHTIMTGAQLKNAGVSQDQTGGIYVVFGLDDQGKEIFGTFTTENVGGLIGILLDKRLISAPVIDEPITGGDVSIRRTGGSFSIDEANQLAIQLRYGSLPVPLRIAESTAVGPTLGEDSLRKSGIAGLIGLLAIMAYMALYYRLPGLVADLALLVYALITVSLFKIIPVTLTLPGVAGFILSLGVAVDANVLIFERMKEELRGGRTIEQAIEQGFSRAWPSIRDSNLSTLITCAILFWFGSTFGASLVKGFSLTLALGVSVSMFTAIFVTRALLHPILERSAFTRDKRWFAI
ncbi:MAG: protein translocase subunit SecD [Anaerolineales bacterium]|nr:protein translocase subunit SecD [Anaerolineales bacterium]